jgi:hypothetical protein
MSLARNSRSAIVLAGLICTLLGAPSAVSQTAPAQAAEPSVPARMIVIRGDPYALRFYPVGRVVNQNAQICLPANALYLTFQKSGGGTVNYGAPGCNKIISDRELERRKIGGGAGMIGA